MFPCMLNEFLIGMRQIIEVSLSEPNIDRDNSLRAQNNLSIHLCIIYPSICRTLVPEICVRPEMLCVFRYIDVLMCVIYK